VPVTAKLLPGGSLAVTANLAARVSVSATRTCTSHGLPLECPLENGAHRVRLDSRDPYLATSFDVTIDGDAVRRELRYAVVTAAAGFAIEGAHGARAVALPEGEHAITVVSDAGERRTVTVAARAGTPLTVP
jgi:hypothetical protein